MGEAGTPVRDSTFSTVSAENMEDFERLMRHKGCWCMLWRLPEKEFNSLSPAERKTRMESIVTSGTIPGILAYASGKPAGWCSIAPRHEFPALSGSDNGSVERQKIWIIVCFYIDRKHRDLGLTGMLIHEALDYAERSGAELLRLTRLMLKAGTRTFPLPIRASGQHLQEPVSRRLPADRQQGR